MTKKRAQSAAPSEDKKVEKK
jgi:hypothetical protein